MTVKRRIKDGRTEDISPKVSWPTGLGVLAAVLLFLSGVVEDDAALAVLLAALGYGGVGAVAGPGTVVEK
jgi:hypothetical protein